MAGFQIYGAGRAGDGTNTNILQIAQALKDMGAWTFSTLDEVYSNINTRDSGFAMRASDRPIYALDDEFDILQAFDEGAMVDVANEGRIPPIMRLRDGGVLIYDSSPRLDYPNTGHEVKLEKVKDLLDAKRLRPASVHDDQGGRAVVDGRRVAGRDGAVFLECGLQSGERLRRGIGTHGLVGVEGERVPLGLWNRHGDDLVREGAGGCGFGSLAMAARGVGVLRFTAHRVLLGDHFA